MERLVFLDESAAKTNMIRLYGRAERGERCVDATPFGHWNTTTMLSSIRLDGSTECIVFPGALNKKLFETYVEHVLSPSLHPGDIVVMDNLHAHQSSKVVEFIQARQAEVRFLPPYTAVSEDTTILIFDKKHNWLAWKSQRFLLVRTHAFSVLFRVIIVSGKQALEQQRFSIA